MAFPSSLTSPDIWYFFLCAVIKGVSLLTARFWNFSLCYALSLTLISGKLLLVVFYQHEAFCDIMTSKHCCHTYVPCSVPMLSFDWSLGFWSVWLMGKYLRFTKYFPQMAVKWQHSYLSQFPFQHLCLRTDFSSVNDWAECHPRCSQIPPQHTTKI